jgi:UDP-N-acetylmuramyl pentapeptide synthase
MYLSLQDLTRIFECSRGAREDLSIYHVTDKSCAEQPKGVFVKLNEESGELGEAIANGAIAAIWEQNIEIPRYTPNHFPIFFVSDPADAVQRLLTFYIEKLDGDMEEKMEITNFNFLTKKLLNKNNQTYDIAVMLETINTKNHEERRRF